MQGFKLGVIVDSFRRSVLEGIESAKKLGAGGIQVWTVAGEMAPEILGAEGRKNFKTLCRDRGLEIAALCGDLGGHGLQIEAENTVKIPRLKLIADLASDMDVPVVTTHIGLVPENRNDIIYRTMLAACRELGGYAKKRGVIFAAETGPEPADRLRRFLEDVDSAGMKVNFDPANMVMVLGSDPAEDVLTLREFIVHTHAKDGVRHRACDPAAVYESFATGGVDGFEFGKYFDEVPLGEGQVKWPEYLGALKEIGYRGYLTIERETGENPEEDIRGAIEFLKEAIHE
jgi:sugar phosphate isomerase/epimerase